MKDKIIEIFDKYGVSTVAPHIIESMATEIESLIEAELKKRCTCGGYPDCICKPKGVHDIDEFYKQ